MISVAYAQDSTRSIYPADRGGVGYKINNAELKGRAIDSTRIFKMGSDTVLRVTDKWYARFAGIYGNGSDMTAKINLFNSRSYVGKMTFEYDTITNVTVNGTVNFVKPVEIGRNASFTGTGTINFNGNILDADPDKVIFGPNITVTGLRTRNGLIPARWFGAVADGSTDNYSFFNKAQSAAATGMTIQVAKGDHRINSAFTQTVSFFGDPGSLVKYNTASVATGVYMWTLSAPGIVLKNLTLDGSDKCMTIVRIGAYPDIHLIGDTLTEWNQVGAETSNTQAVFFGQGCDRFKVMHCTIKNGDAKNNSIVRGIRGDYAGVGPVGAEIAWNTFSGIRGTAAGLDDADDICVQSFTNDLGMKIHHNLHLDMWKRAAKLMSNGIEYYENQIWSNRYATNSTKSWSVYSIYGNNVYAHNNTLWTGIFENCVDIGPYQDGSGPILNCSVENERFLMSTGASGTKDGIVLFGTNNNNITFKNNYIQNCRNGIASRGNARNFTISNNVVYNSSDNAYSLASTNTYPNNWFYNMNVNNNIARKCLQANFAIGRVSGGSLSYNSSDSCSDDLILNYAPYVDSLLGVIATGNFTSPSGYGSAKKVNIGNYSQRLTLTNQNSLPGLQYIATDSSNSTYLWQGGAYVKIGASSGGGGSVTSVGLSMPSNEFSVTGSPVTGSGTLTATLKSQSANYFWGAPNGSAGSPTFRALVAADIPSLDASKITSGTFNVSRLGTGTPSGSNFLRGDGTWAAAGGSLPTLPSGYPYISDGSSGADSSIALYVDRSNKRIGIGTASPTQTLYVSGSAFFGTDNDVILGRTTNNVLKGLSFVNSSNAEGAFVKLNPQSGEFRLGGASNNYYPTFYSNGAEKMRLDASGRLLVGTTTSPSILGYSDLPLTLYRSPFSGFGIKTSTQEAVVALQTGALDFRSSTAFAISTGGSNERLRITSTGNIGIATSSPTHPLTLGSTAMVGGGGIAMYSTTDQVTNYQRMRMYSDASNIFSFNLENGGTGSVGSMSFKINGTEKLAIDNNYTTFKQNFLFSPDNTNTIGRLSVSPARPSIAYIGTAVQSGAAANTTIRARMDLGPSTTSLPHIFFDKGVKPSTLSDGQLWYSNEKKLNFWNGTDTTDLLASGMTNPMTTAGDIIVGGSGGTPTRLAKGTNGQVLTMVSGNVAWSNGSSISGIYKPDTLNVFPAGSSITLDSLIYTKVGNVVHVAGKLSYTAGTVSGYDGQIILSLPYYATTSPSVRIGGGGTAYKGTSPNEWTPLLIENYSSTYISLRLNASSSTGYDLSFDFSYRTTGVSTLE